MMTSPGNLPLVSGSPGLNLIYDEQKSDLLHCNKRTSSWQHRWQSLGEAISIKKSL